MNFTLIDCMFVIHDMDHLNKLKINFNVSCDVSHHEEEIKKKKSKYQKLK